MSVSLSTDGTLVLPPGVVLTSPGRRLLCSLLDGILVIVTLGIGWFIWQFFTFRTGQTPAKQLMKMHVVSLSTGKPFPFWMTLLREWIIKGFIAGLTFGIAYLWLLWDDKNQTLYDKVLSTVVVDDPNGVLLAVQLAPSPTTNF